MSPSKASTCRREIVHTHTHTHSSYPAADRVCVTCSVCVLCDEYVMMLAGLVSWMRRGQRGSVSLHLRRSPQNCPAPLEWKPNIFSSSLCSVACRMHNPCLNKARTAPHRCVWCDRSVGVRDMCIPACGIVESQHTWLEHYPPGLHPTAICCPPPPTHPTTHLLYQFMAVIYIIQMGVWGVVGGGCLWAPNHLLAFIS